MFVRTLMRAAALRDFICPAFSRSYKRAMNRIITFTSLLASLLTPAFHPAAAASSEASGDAIQGIWYTQDRDGGVELYSCDSKICGRLYWLKDDTGSRDEHNPDPGKRQRPLCQMQLMGDFTKNADGRYTDGWIYDPDSGSTYRAQIKIVDRDTLELRGYVLIPLFGGSQIWKRAGSISSCSGG